MPITDYYQDYAKYNSIDTSGWQGYDGGWVDSYGNSVSLPDYSKFSQAVAIDPNGKINYDLRQTPKYKYRTFDPTSSDLGLGLSESNYTNRRYDYNKPGGGVEYYFTDPSTGQEYSGSQLEEKYGYVQSEEDAQNAKAFADPFYWGGDKNKFSNKQLYDSLLKQGLATSSKYFGDAPWDQLYGKFSPYDPYTDYREGSYEELSSPIPGFQGLVDQRNKGRDKAFNKQVLSSVITFLTAGAGAALGVANAAAGAAAGATTGGTVGALGGAAGGGGLFAGNSGLLGNFGSSLANSAINSAIQGGLSSAISGGNPVTGALTGGLSGGLGSVLNGVDFGLGQTGNDALSGALRGGVSSGVSGGNPLIGAATGGASSGFSSLLKGGFNFGGADVPNVPVDGAFQGGGYQLPGGFLEQGNDSSFGTSSPFNIDGGAGGGNVGIFDGFFDGSEGSFFNSGGSFSDSVTPNPLDFSGQLSNDDFINNLFGYSQGTGANNLDIFSGLGDTNLNNNPLLSGFQGIDFGDPNLNNFLNNPGTFVDLSNSEGPRVNGEQSQTLTNLLSKYGPKVLQTLLGGGAAGGAGGGGGGGGGGGRAGGGGSLLEQLLGIGTGAYGLYQSGRLNDNARDIAARADPFSPHRERYAQLLNNLVSNPRSITETPGWEAGLEAVQRSMAAQGYTGSGNMILELQKYGGDFYTKQADLLGRLAGAQFSPGQGAQIEYGGALDRAQLQGTSLNNLALNLGLLSRGFQ